MEKSTNLTKIIIAVFAILWITLLVLIMVRVAANIKTLGLLLAILILAFISLVFAVVSVYFIVNANKVNHKK